MIYSIMYALVTFIIGLFSLVWIYKQMTNPKKVVEGSKAVELYYTTPPGPLQLCISWQLTILQISIQDLFLHGTICLNQDIYLREKRSHDLKFTAMMQQFHNLILTSKIPHNFSHLRFLRICAFDKSRKELPISFPFCNSLPLLGFVAAHKAFPMRVGSTQFEILCNTCEGIKRDDSYEANM